MTTKNTTDGARLEGSPGGPTRARIIIADGDPLAARVIRDAFERADGFVVVAQPRNGVEAVELALHYRPDVVLLEAGLPQVDGLTALARITAQAPEVHVIVLSTTPDDELGLTALRAGASGFLTKSVGDEGIVSAVRAALRGEIAASRAMTGRLVDYLRSTAAFGVGMRPVKSTLTSREWEVLDILTLGRTTREIADELFLTEDTVQSHVKNILRKLGVHSRAEAVERGNQLRGGYAAPQLAVAA